MTTWNNSLSESHLAAVSAAALSCVTFLIQYLLNPVYPPNHNDFLGFDIATQTLWYPWFVLERLLYAVFSSIAYIEIVSFIAVSCVSFSLYWAVYQLNGSRGGLGAAVLYTLSPFAVSAATVVPAPSLVGFAVAAALIAAGLTRGRFAAGITVVLGLILGFFPIYAAGFILSVILAALFEWVGFERFRSFNSSLALAGVTPSFVATLVLDGGTLQSLVSASVSTISSTLPAGFSVSTMLTWFGPLTLLLGLVGVYRSMDDATANTPLFAALGIVGVVLFAQRIVDPLLGFAFFGLGVFTLSGVAINDLLDIDVRNEYVFAVYTTIIAVLVVAIVNLLAFIQTDVSASRPLPGDIDSYQGLSNVSDQGYVTAPREAPLAGYFLDEDAVLEAWQVNFSDATVFRAVFLTDLVERAGANRTVIVSNWVESKFDSVNDRLNASSCFMSVYKSNDSRFGAWENECQVTVSTASQPITS
jgi:hypothetical protein